MTVIVADRNIPGIETALALHGAEVRMFTDPAEAKPLLEGAECLLCRSTMKVNEQLLDGSAIRFVATATSGTDHFDEEHLRSRHIEFSDAKGSNARSVAEYVFAALLHLEESKGIDFHRKTIGIVGAGHVGSQVERIARGLGMPVLLCDPPLRDATGSDTYVEFGDVLRNADILSMHVPLSKSGPYPTYGMMRRETFAAMPRDAIFINASRGGIVDEYSLREAIDMQRFGAVVLDVFGNEPDVDPDTVFAADIATPHIAGHSFDGKLLGTQMVYDALCEFMNWRPLWDHREHLPASEHIVIDDLPPQRIWQCLYRLQKLVYNIETDHRALLKIVKTKGVEKGTEFKRYRSVYPLRRENSAYTIEAHECPEALERELAGLGFKVEQPRRGSEAALPVD